MMFNCFFCNLQCKEYNPNFVGSCDNCSSTYKEVYTAKDYAHIYIKNKTFAHFIYHIRLLTNNNKTEIISNQNYDPHNIIILDGFPISPKTSIETIKTIILLS